MAVMLVLAACSGGSEEETSTEEGAVEETATEETTEDSTEETATEEAADTISYDNQFEIGSGDSGDNGESTQVDETVELPKNSDKVVIFDLGVASTFAALDLEENIMGLPKGENNASLGSTIEDVYSSEDYVNLGGLKEPDYEALAGLDPEIIMIHGRQSNSAVVSELEKAAPNAEIIHVAADNSNYFEDVKAMTMFIGEMYDEQDKAQELVDDLDAQLAEVNDKVTASELDMLFIQTNGGNLSFHGVGGRYDFLYNDFGFTSAGEQEESEEEVTDSHGNEISFEFVAETNPGMILVMDRGAATSTGEATQTDILVNEVTSGVDAIENDNVYELNPQNWYLNAGGYLTALSQIEEIGAAIDAATAE